jgi:hypothetical protein
MKFETRLISPLEKVFPEEELKAEIYNRSSALIGEYVSFQFAVKADELKLNQKLIIALKLEA